jgi:hypothetical protein
MSSKPEFPRATDIPCLPKGNKAPQKPRECCGTGNFEVQDKKN